MDGSGLYSSLFLTRALCSAWKETWSCFNEVGSSGERIVTGPVVAVIPFLTRTNYHSSEENLEWSQQCRPKSWIDTGDHDVEARM
jgi:hypothetical protein